MCSRGQSLLTGKKFFFWRGGRIVAPAIASHFGRSKHQLRLGITTPGGAKTQEPHMATATFKGFTFSSTADVLALVATSKLTPDDAVKALALVNPKGSAGTIRFKVSEKGAVSVYGLNVKFPVTLYADQWERLLDKVDDLRAFIKANAGKLSRKAE
jgi:hypothetical protein